MNAQHAGDLGQGTSVKIICAQNQAIFRRKSGKRLVGGTGQPAIGRRDRVGIRRSELHTLFGFFIKTDQALCLAVAVDVLLGEDGTKPPLERATTGVGGQLRDALSLTSRRAVEIGIESVGEVVGGGILANNSQSGEVELFSIPSQKKLPGLFVSRSAGTGQGKFIDA